MNGKDCLLAFADLDKSYVAAANDIETIRYGFNQQKKRRTRMIGAVCGCIVIIFAVAAFGSGRWFRQTPAVLPPGTGAADRLQTEPFSTEATGTAPGFIPPETQATPQSPEPSAVVPPAVDATTKKPESAFEKSYQYALNGYAYSFYMPGKVIAPEMVGEKIGDATVTAGWKYADGTMPVTEQLRCEVYRIAGIDPGTAVCIKFLDKGEALTTDHFYVQINALADSSAVSAYTIPTQPANSEE